MTVTRERSVITGPGVYDIPEDVYHADPVDGGSLSASGAKKLLACPARFDYDRRHPPKSSAAMELGTAAHKIVLGVGADLVLVDADNYRTKAAQEIRDAARAAGKVPLLPAEMAEAEAMAAAVRAHPLAGRLFDGGEPERSLFWVDEHTGIWRRSRLDWLPFPSARRMVIPDLKTGMSVSPDAIAKAVWNFGYYIQAPWYVDAVRALGLDDDPDFLLVFVETAPPYLVTVAGLDDDAMRTGRERGRKACERFRDCTESGIWPGYTDEVQIEWVSLPRWARLRDEEDW